MTAVTSTARQNGLSRDAENAGSDALRARCVTFYEAFDAAEDDNERGALLKAWYSQSRGAHPVRPEP